MSPTYHSYGILHRKSSNWKLNAPTLSKILRYSPHFPIKLTTFVKQQRNKITSIAPCLVCFGRMPQMHSRAASKLTVTCLKLTQPWTARASSSTPARTILVKSTTWWTTRFARYLLTKKTSSSQFTAWCSPSLHIPRSPGTRFVWGIPLFSKNRGIPRILPISVPRSLGSSPAIFTGNSPSL